MNWRELKVDQVENLRRNPATPDWAKQLIDVVAEKDPVDVANTLDLLTAAFEAKVRKLTG